MKYGASVSKSRRFSGISLAVFRDFKLSGHVIIGVNPMYEFEKRCNHLFATTHSSDMQFPGQEPAQHCEEVFLSIPTVNNGRFAKFHSEQDHLFEGCLLVALRLLRQFRLLGQS